MFCFFIEIPYPGEEDFLFSFEQHKYHPVCLMNSEGIVQVQKQIKLEMIITFSHLNNDTMSPSNKRQKNRTSSNNQHTDIVECISTGPVAPLKVTGN